MRVAIVHDYIKEYGGAERVLEAIHDIFPDAPVFTTIYAPSFLGPHKHRFERWDIRPSWLNKIPFSHKLISPLRLLAPVVFRSMNFSKYDVVIVSATGAYQPNCIKKNGAIHVCYCHTPPRYLYGYATARNWKKNVVMRICGEIANHFLRITDVASSQNVDYFIANSKEVAGRIQKFYKRDATIIYPPVVTGVKNTKKPRTYFLAGGRLAAAKHIEIAIQACNTLRVPLKIFGKGFAGYGESLRALAGPTIEFVGEVSDDEKWKLLQGARAYLFPSEDEDFGILPVEAMAAGTPVIAYYSGGVKETVVEGKTGLFFQSLTSVSLSQKLKEFIALKNLTWESSCQKQASLFSQKTFLSRFQAFIQRVAKKA